MKLFCRFFGLWCALMLTALLSFGCGDDDKPTGTNGDGNAVFPNEWIGRWAGVSQSGPCSFAGLGGGEADTFSICEGDRLDTALAGEEIEFTCDIDLNPGGGTFDCSASFTFGACTVMAGINGTITRTGDNLTVTQRVETTYSEACGETDECEEGTATYTRISETPNPEECFGSGDGGGGLNEFSVDISGDGFNLALEGSPLVTLGGGIYTIAVSSLAGDDVYTMSLMTPVITDVPVSLCIGAEEDGCVVGNYVESVGGQSGFMSGGTGTMNITRADGERFEATFSWSGDLVGKRSGTRTFSNGSIAADVTPLGLRMMQALGLPWTR